MGAFTHRSISLTALVVSAACSSTLCYASEIQVANGRLDGAVSVREDTTYWTNGNQIEIIAKTTDWFPITATSDAVLKFEFRREEGTVLINTLGSYSESAISPQTKPLHLYVKNGSLKIDATGQSYHSSGLIHTYLGKDIDIDKNLTISYKDSKTDPTDTYSGILAEGTDIRVGRSFDISLERVNWEHGKRSELFGLIGTNANNQMKASWSFGEDDNNSVFKVHDIYSGSESEGVQAGGIILYSEISAPLDLCATIYGYAEITGIYAFTKDMSAMAYAVGAEVGDGAVLDFKKSLIVKNISARNDDSLTSDNLGEKLSSGAYGQNAEAYSLNAYDDARILVNSSQEADAVVQIENDMMVDTGAEINAYYLNEESHFYGTVFQNTSEGKVSFKFSDGANWRLSQSNTHPVNLTLANNAAVYLNRTSNGNTKELTIENANTLTLSSLNGENSTFHLSTAVNEAYGDSINITSGSGSFGLMVQGTGEEPTEVALNRALVRAEESNIEFSLANDGGVVDLGNYVYGLASRTDKKAKEWYLTNQTPDNPDPEDPDNPNVPVDPDEPGGETEGDGGHPVLSPSATAVLALAGSGAQTSQFLYGLSDIRKRTGDVRQKAADGLYAMARGGKNRISGFASTSFKDEYGALSIGFDREFASNWIAGAVFEAIEGDQTVRSNGYKAEGESSTQALKGYLSWFGEKGSYADVVFGVSYFDQDISTKMLDGTGVSGGFSGWGWGASIEAGHQFLMDSDSTWFIEPQVQLSYFRVQGDSFALTNAMRVDQEDADSLTGRLGLVVGRTILTDSGSGWQFSVKGGLSHEFLDEADIHVNGERFTGSTLGTRGYYGVAFDWYASDAVRVFGQIEREEGAHYTSEINARVGVKYCF